jgi:hypothetical protein
MAIANRTAIIIAVPVNDAMAAIFYVPMAAIGRENTLWGSLLRGTGW